MLKKTPLIVGNIATKKAASDLIVRSWRKTYGLPAIITYCTNNFGPNQNDEKYIPTIIKSLKLGTKVPVYGDGKNKREWIFVKNHVSSKLLCMC